MGGWLNTNTSSSGGGSVNSVTGLNTNNLDPANPVVNISVDGTTITGAGTPASPLQATFIPTTNYGLYSQTDISAIIVNDDTQKTLIGAGVGTLSVPANFFQVGDSFVARLGGEINNLNNTKITFRVSTLATILVDTGLLELKIGNNQFWQLLICFTIREIGSAGVGSIISNGNFTHIRNNTATEVFGFNTINNSTFDTTIPSVLNITAQWETKSTSNSIHSDYFVLNKIY